MFELLKVAGVYDCYDSDFAVRLDKLRVSIDGVEDFLSIVFD